MNGTLLRLMALLATAALSLGACGSDSSDSDETSPSNRGDAAASTQPSTSDDTATSDEAAEPGTDTTQREDDSDPQGSDEVDSGETSTTSDSETIDFAVPGELSPSDPFRLAPAAQELRTDLHYWTANQAGRIEDGTWTATVEGPLTELADGGGLGVLFTRDGFDSTTIYLADEQGLRPLIEGAGNERLELEGVATGGAGGPTVYFQRYVPGSPIETVSTLERLDPETGETSEVVQVGGWESGTSFSSITGDESAGIWSGEGFYDLQVFDLASGTVIHDQGGPESECSDGDPDCVTYDAATVLDGAIYGVRPIFNDDQGFIDGQGIFRYDPDTGTDDLIVAYPWDNGTWYVEDLFAIGDELVVSLSDGPRWPPDERQPLPALFIDPSAPDEATTSPLSAYVRPRP